VKTHVLAALIGALIMLLGLELWPQTEEVTQPIRLHSNECDRGLLHRPFEQKEILL
jgi:hypothetical protein